MGQDVRLVESPLKVFGDVAAIGDLAESATDWALIEVRPGFASRVFPSMLNHPQLPTGATSAAETNAGDPVQLNDPLLVPRRVPPRFDDTEIYRTAGTLDAPPSTVPFDSGGPLAHVETGKALGTVSRGLNCSLPSLVCEEHEGPTVEGVLAKAPAAGFPTLRAR